MKKISPCSNCGSTEQRLANTHVVSGMLPDAGGWLQVPMWNVVACLDCGLVRYFASRDALNRIAESEDWHRT